jgi:hypothetical protein
VINRCPLCDRPLIYDNHGGYGVYCDTLEEQPYPHFSWYPLIIRGYYRHINFWLSSIVAQHDSCNKTIKIRIRNGPSEELPVDFKSLDDLVSYVRNVESSLLFI